MSERAFRIYKIFATVLCICALLVGGLLGWLSLQLERKPPEHSVESIVLPTQSTVPPTTVPSEPGMPENLSPEEQIYWQYHAELAHKEDYTYTLSDMDGNGVPEMLIWRGSNGLREIVTIENGEAVSIIEDYDLFLCEGNTFGQYGEGSGGCTVWYYQIKDSVAEPIVCLVWMFHEDAWYTSTDYTGDWDTMTPITVEEKNQIVSQYLPLDRNIPETGYLHFLYNDILN